MTHQPQFNLDSLLLLLFILLLILGYFIWTICKPPKAKPRKWPSAEPYGKEVDRLLDLDEHEKALMK